MIQDIYPHVYHNEYRQAVPEPDSFLLYYEEGQVLGRNEASDGLTFPRFRHLDGNGASAESVIYLFTIDGAAYFLTLERPRLNEEAAEAFSLLPEGIFRSAKPLYQAFAGITGQQLKNWYDTNRYCGCCGSELKPSEKERMLHCPVCGHMIYPKISPAVIVGVISGNRLLMTRYSGRAYKRYALIAGFNEIGETIEDTVRREVMEEVGVKVKNIRFYKSQPWSFSETLLMGFYCDLDGSDEIHLDTEELSEGVWMEREDIPETSEGISLTEEMIQRFRKGLEQTAIDKS